MRIPSWLASTTGRLPQHGSSYRRRKSRDAKIEKGPIPEEKLAVVEGTEGGTARYESVPPFVRHLPSFTLLRDGKRTLYLLQAAEQRVLDELGAAFAILGE